MPGTSRFNFPISRSYGFQLRDSQIEHRCGFSHRPCRGKLAKFFARNPLHGSGCFAKPDGRRIKQLDLRLLLQTSEFARKRVDRATACPGRGLVNGDHKESVVQPIESGAQVSLMCRPGVEKYGQLCLKFLQGRVGWPSRYTIAPDARFGWQRRNRNEGQGPCSTPISTRQSDSASPPAAPARYRRTVRSTVRKRRPSLPRRLIRWYSS